MAETAKSQDLATGSGNPQQLPGPSSSAGPPHPAQDQGQNNQVQNRDPAQKTDDDLLDILTKMVELRTQLLALKGKGMDEWMRLHRKLTAEMGSVLVDLGAVIQEYRHWRRQDGERIERLERLLRDRDLTETTSPRGGDEATAAAVAAEVLEEMIDELNKT